MSSNHCTPPTSEKRSLIALPKELRFLSALNLRNFLLSKVRISHAPNFCEIGVQDHVEFLF